MLSRSEGAGVMSDVVQERNVPKQEAGDRGIWWLWVSLDGTTTRGKATIIDISMTSGDTWGAADRNSTETSGRGETSD